MTITERLFAIMKDKNIKQKELADALGINSANVSAWYKRGTNPPIEYAIDICNYLDISIEFLIYGNDKNVNNITLDNNENYIIESYRKCNETGKQRIMEQVNFMQQNFPREKEKSSTLRIG